MSAALLSNFTPIPKSFLRVGLSIPCDLHIYLAANDHLLMLRKAGSTLEERDMATVAKAAEGSLLVAKADYEKMMKAFRESNAANVAADPSSPAAISAATEMLKNLQAPNDGSANTDEEKLNRTKAMLDSSFEFVKDIMQKAKQGASAQTLLGIMQAQDDKDPLRQHCRHVSGVAALGLIAIGNASIEEVTDIAFAGLIHDLGLSELPNVLLAKHMQGVPSEALTSAEKMMLMRHTTNVFDQLKKTKTFVSDGARRIVEQHHENWSGTGFTGVKGGQIFRAARLLRIADELVSHLQNASSPKDITEAFVILRAMRDPVSGESDLDPAMLAVFEQSFW